MPPLEDEYLTFAPGWVLWIRIPHTKPCPAHRDMSWTPYEIVGLAELGKIYYEKRSRMKPASIATFNAILGVLDPKDQWGLGDEEFDSQTVKKYFPLEEVRSAFLDALKDVPQVKEYNASSFPNWRMWNVLLFFDKHPGCNDMTRFELVYGW